MKTRVDEIADHIYRLSTFVPDIGPTGFTFNQFLIDADEPTIFHTGPRAMFSAVSEAVSSVLALERLRWIMFGHLEADECGAMNLFLDAAPNAKIAHTAVGCMVSINDLADRPPEPIPDQSTIDLGGKRMPALDRVRGCGRLPHGVQRPLEDACVRRRRRFDCRGRTSLHTTAWWIATGRAPAVFSAVLAHHQPRTRDPPSVGDLSPDHL